MTLPNLQSMIIILIKAILSHVTVLVTQANAPNGLQTNYPFQDNQNGNGSTRLDYNGANGQNGNFTTNEQIDSMRTQEILDKAVSGVLILLLKWLKVSRKYMPLSVLRFSNAPRIDILKFEYVTQLLVDSSYVPLILKLLQLQDIEKIVNFKCEQEELKYVGFLTSRPVC